MRSAFLAAAALVAGLFPLVGPGAQATTCTTRTLVLSAYPAEADAVLTHVALEKKSAMVLSDRHFYLGAINGKRVATAMTGIGFVNASQTATAALTGFSCSKNHTRIGAVVFSGVAGGANTMQIADVAVPARWTVNDGKTWMPVDSAMLAAAKRIKPKLKSQDTTGDPLCTCQDPDLITVVDLKRSPKVVVGGDGSSADVKSDGTAELCEPGGGNIFGCTPCRAPDRPPLPDPVATVTTLPAFFSSLISSNTGGTTSSSGRTYDASDEETGAVQKVARAHRLPFLAFRGTSDGAGDPLHLPGFPFEFFVYTQIAAENAATAAADFFKVWKGPAV